MRKEIKRLCRSLLYIAALRLCPCVRKRRATKAEACGEREYISFEQGHQAGPIDIFGRVIGNLPAGMMLSSGRASFEYREKAPDFGVLCRHRPTPCSICVRTKDADSPRKTGLDLLRATLNLARGDLEQNAVCACA